jgi:hypothetical protein
MAERIFVIVRYVGKVTYNRCMRKSLALITLMAYPTFAQVSSGTSIILNFTKDEIVVAADSRSVNDDGSVPDNSYCKIAEIRHQFIFTSAGRVRYKKVNPADTIEGWNNTDAARNALQNATKGMNIDDTYMEGVAAYWGAVIKGHWTPLCLLNQQKCASNVGLLGVAPHQEVLTDGIFVGAKGMFLKGASVYFDTDYTKLLNPVYYGIGTSLGHCWPCGQGEQICAAGSHVDVAAQFCAERKPETKLSIRTALTGADKHVKLAVKIVEKTIDTYDRAVGDVGGPVDAVTATKDGKITWNARKHNCPENQD